MEADDADTAFSHLLFPNSRPSLAEGSGRGGELEGKLETISIGTEGSAFSKSPASLIKEGFALLNIEGVDGDVLITGIRPVTLRNEGVENERTSLLAGEERVTGIGNGTLVGAVRHRLADTKIIQRIRRESGREGGRSGFGLDDLNHLSLDDFDDLGLNDGLRLAGGQHNAGNDEQAEDEHETLSHLFSPPENFEKKFINGFEGRCVTFARGTSFINKIPFASL
jgi:hypothetical protein